MAQLTRQRLIYQCPDCGVRMREKRLADRRGRHPKGAVTKHKCPDCGYAFWTDECEMPLWQSAEPLLERYKREIERRKAIMRHYHFVKFGITTGLAEAEVKGT